MIVEIHRFDSCDDLEPLCSLGLGKHSLGRGYSLQCPDKRVSRNHAQIDVSETTVTITAKHEINPCFFRPAESNNISLLKFNWPTELTNGDTFGFFPDQYWFRIKITNPDLPTETPTVGNDAVVPTSPHHQQEVLPTNGILNGEVLPTVESSEEVLPTVSESTNCDKLNESSTNRSEINQEGLPTVPDSSENIQEELPTANPSDNSALNNSGLPTVANPSNIPALPTVSEEANQVLPTVSGEANQVLPTVAETDTALPTVTIKKEVCSDEEVDSGQSLTAVKTEKPDSPVTVKQENKVVRDRCWYGDKCFRKNPDHKSEYSHPGDVDYDTDPKDPRPSCSYGDRCYRRNGQHRKDFRHPKGAHAKKMPRRPRQKRKLSNQSNSGDDDTVDAANVTNQKRQRKKVVQQESPEDDYDRDDPFIDDSEDEYEAESFDSESDDDYESP